MKKKLKRYIENLLEETKAWDERYLAATIHAVEKYDQPEDVERTIRKFLTKQSTMDFKLTNPFSKQIWLKELLLASRSVMDDKRRPFGSLGAKELTLAFVTFTDSEWCYPATKVNFDLERAKQKVRNVLKRVDYIGCFEVAYYSNEMWARGKHQGNLLSFHCHAIVWTGESRSTLNRWRKGFKNRFTPVLQNSSGIHINRVSRRREVYKLLRYQAKMPSQAYATVTDENEKKTQKKVRLSFRARNLLFNIFKNYEVKDVWFGGGEGAEILRDARARIKVLQRANGALRRKPRKPPKKRKPRKPRRILFGQPRAPGTPAPTWQV